MKTNLQSLIKRNFHKVALCGMLGLTSLGAFAQQNTNLGKVNSFKDLLSKNVGTSVGRTQSNNLKFQLPSGVIEAKVSNSFKKSGKESFSGKILNHGLTSFFVDFSNGKAQGFIILFDEKKSYEFTTNQNGEVVLAEKNFDKVIAIDDFLTPNQVSTPVASGIANTPGKTGNGDLIPLLQSNPGTTTVLYLDFDGENVQDAGWNDGNAFVANNANISANDVKKIYEMMAEDFAPFNINVTTDRAVYDATPVGRRSINIYTPTCFFAGCPGGIAYPGSFVYAPERPCFTFIYNTSVENFAEAGSHESGHVFGLSHDGRNLPNGISEGYYGGHEDWGPILGASYGRNVTQFSKGEYQYANNLEDDLSIIARAENAFGYKVDDHGNNNATATVISNLTASGLISTATDKDYFKFTVSGASSKTVNINVTSKFSSNTNLNIATQLFNSSNQLIATSNNTETLNAILSSLTLANGDYYLVVDGVGEGDYITGYSDYGSLGYYNVELVYETEQVSCTDPAYNATTAYNGGQKVSYNNIIYTANWWTQGAQPDLNSGPVGTGKPWTATGTCAVQNVVPTVTVTSPTEGQVLTLAAGQKVNFTVSTTPSVVDSVKYILVDVVCNGPGCTTVRRFTQTTAPYSLSVDPIAGAVSSQVNVVAFKNGRASDVTAAVNYSVVDPVKPIVTITSPTQNSVNYQYPSDANLTTINLGFNVATSAIDSVRFIVVETKCDGPGCTVIRNATVKTAPFAYAYLPTLKYNGYTQVQVVAFSKGVASDVATTNYNVKPLPEVFFVTPVNNSSVSRSVTTVPVTVTVNTDNLAIDSVVYFISDFSGFGQTTSVIDSKVVVKSSPFGFNLPVRAGQNFTRITAVAFGDGGKNSRGLSTQVYYNDAPVVTITAPTVGSKFNIGGSVTVSANVTDDGNVSQVEIYSPHIPNSTVTLTAAPYTATFTNLASSGNRFLTTFIVKATDNQGAVTVQTIDVAENRLPAITVTAPLAVSGINPKYKVGYPVTVSANVSDQDGTIKKVVFTLPKTGETIVDSILPYSVTFANLPAPYADGTLYFTVTAFDNNNATSATNVIVYKNRVPSATITSPVANATFNTNANITVTALPYDPDFTSGKIEYFVNGSSKIGEQIINSVLTAGTQYSVNFNNVANGIYDFTARITDDMGEFAYSPAVRVEVKTPTVTCTAPVYNAATAYNGGQSVQYNGIKYTANWWTQGAQPDLNNGAVGTGKPWTSNGTCNTRTSDNVEIITATSIYPNPSSGLFTIETETESSAVILNAFGKEVATLSLVKGQNEVNLSLASGVYFVKINNNVTKLVIE